MPSQSQFIIDPKTKLSAVIHAGDKTLNPHYDYRQIQPDLLKEHPAFVEISQLLLAWAYHAGREDRRRGLSRQKDGAVCLMNRYVATVVPSWKSYCADGDQRQSHVPLLVLLAHRCRFKASSVEVERVQCQKGMYEKKAEELEKEMRRCYDEGYQLPQSERE